jgi:hypothetical protein
MFLAASREERKSFSAITLEFQKMVKHVICISPLMVSHILAIYHCYYSRSKYSSASDFVATLSSIKFYILSAACAYYLVSYKTGDLYIEMNKDCFSHSQKNTGDQEKKGKMPGFFNIR